MSRSGVEISGHDPLPGSFYEGEDVVYIAQKLLGQLLCTSIDGHFCKGIIVETEAYRAPEDKASHAYGNKRTARTEVMFGPPGTAYIYLCYGIHHLFNIVTAPEGVAHAILVRAIEPLEGIDVMLKRRGRKDVKPMLTAGPGVMSKAMGLHTRYSGADLVRSGKIWIAEGPFIPNADQITASARVGVQYAEECASWPWRFRVKSNPWTSPAK